MIEGMGTFGGHMGIILPSEALRSAFVTAFNAVRPTTSYTSQEDRRKDSCGWFRVACEYLCVRCMKL